MAHPLLHTGVFALLLLVCNAAALAAESSPSSPPAGQTQTGKNAPPAQSLPNSGAAGSVRENPRPNDTRQPRAQDAQPRRPAGADHAQRPAGKRGEQRGADQGGSDTRGAQGGGGATTGSTGHGGMPGSGASSGSGGTADPR
ncbi:hypothetical protein CEK29_11630 [Bordetella genomosp. 5]|uniref:hypothetical protein n=1 Tax=Bordetella genomosp. 5 TaxID=1395608 RepID=UPI000B9DD370|nr:hypothetical protein [Bordetella genomosp. 5]OZI43774.1 hypothetical protein CEK29_11630 [Bordetella genomosp. 5]